MKNKPTISTTAASTTTTTNDRFSCATIETIHVIYDVAVDTAVIAIHLCRMFWFLLLLSRILPANLQKKKRSKQSVGVSLSSFFNDLIKKNCWKLFSCALKIEIYWWLFRNRNVQRCQRTIKVVCSFFCKFIRIS